MKRIGYFLTVGALAAAMLAGCSTSNQKAEETTAAPTQTESAASAESKEEAESTAEEVKGDVSGEYSVKPRQITDHKVKLGLIPVAMNTSYTMTINGAKKQIAENGDQIELIVQAPSSNASTITEQGNIMETMIQQGVDAIALATESDESMLPYLREAAEADIPVFLFNMTEINDQNIYYVSSIGYDQEKAGYDIGKWINDNLGDKPQKCALPI